MTNRQLFVRFFRFGLQAWGGPVAQIGMLRHELVDQDRWVSSSRFNRLLSVYQVLPGPEAHELAVHLGMVRGGRIGGVLAGLGFMLPGFVLMLALSWLYFRVDLTHPALVSAFFGVQVVVLALIARAVHRIGGHVLTDHWLWAIATGACLASLAGVPFWLALPVSGLVYGLRKRGQPSAVSVAVAAAAGAAIVILWLHTGGATTPTNAPATDPTLMTLFLSGLKAGLLTFGGAYTVIPFLRDDAVGSGWMTDARFLDGVALSGILPAPLIIFSTFVGYVAGGVQGALAITVGIFLPAFAFTLLFFERLEAVLDNPKIHALLEGVAAGVVGLILATTIELAVALVDRLPSLVSGGLIAAGAFAMLSWSRSRVIVPLVVFAGGMAGLLLFQVLHL